MIDEQQAARWKELVPAPLAQAAAVMLCEQDAPCDDCIDSAADMLSLVYAYNAHAKPGNPCPACRFVRANPKDYHEACVFHEGMDQGMLSGWHPTSPVKVTTKPHESWWHRLPSLLPILSPRQYFVIGTVIVVAWMALILLVVTHS